MKLYEKETHKLNNVRYIRYVDEKHQLDFDYNNDTTHVRDTDGNVLISFSSSNEILKDGKIIGHIHWHAHHLEAVSDTPFISVKVQQTHAESHIDLEAEYAKAYINFVK